MVGRSQVEDLFDVLWRDLTWVAASHGTLSEQGVSPACLISLLPPVERGSGNIKLTASLDDIADRLSILKNDVAVVSAEGISDLLIHIETSFSVRYSSS